MTTSKKRFVQKAIAVVLIVAYSIWSASLLRLYCLSRQWLPAVWCISRRSQNRELRGIFQFYLAADSILRDKIAVVCF